jgi:hypothetical protein
MKKPLKRRIGALERVSIPEWGLHGVTAKIDTGAFTSSIDISTVEVLTPREGELPVAVIQMGEGKMRRTVTASVIGFRRVRNSSGQATNRPIVEAVISLAGKRFRTPINLHRREGMTYRMIIGRRALAGRFVVDVARAWQRAREERRASQRRKG